MKAFTSLKRTEETSIKYKLAIDLSKQDNTIALSVADSDYETCPSIKEALKVRVDHGAFGYLGVPSGFRTLIKDWFQRRYGVEIKKTHVIFSTKVLQAMAIALNALTQEGDKVLIQSPVYHVFMPLVKDNKRTLVDSPLILTGNAYAMDFEDLQAKFKDGVKAMLLCSPHNPVGRVYRHEELKQLVALAKAHNVILISDEIHADLMIESETFTSAATFFNEYKNIIVVSAPSKTFNVAGLQAAHMVTTNQEYLLKLKRVLQALHAGSPNVLALSALQAAYTECDGWVEAQNAHIKKNYHSLIAALAQWKNLKITRLEGTYLAWLDIRLTQLTSTEFVNRLAKEEGLVLSDGTKFAPYETAYVRLNLACSSAQLKDALARFNRFIESLKL